MQARAPDPPRHQLLLAGGGHSHALLLRRWLMAPSRRPRSTAITLVNRQATALYSGMVPGLVAGLYRLDDCSIDLRLLCQRAGVTFVQAEIIGVDPARRQLLLQGRPPLRFDRLSLDLGAVTAVADTALAVKPLEPFLAWCDSLAAAGPPQRPLRIRGGGAAAVELALALRGRAIATELLLRGDGLHLPSPAANRAAEQLLAQAGIAVRRRVGPEVAADLACTGSHAPPWLAASGLPVDPASGRLLTLPSLQVLDQPRLFAVGDCALVAATPRPPSGVWAVRAAPLLAENLRRSLDQPQRPLRPWNPQRRALQLLGDGGWLGSPGRRPRALACWGPLLLGPSPLLWRWKDWIDRRFIARFAPPAAAHHAANHAAGLDAAHGGAAAMACRGCAAKLAATPLRSALGRLAAAASPPSGSQPDPGSAQGAFAEDAAAIATTADGRLLLQSVDGFPALVEDPWLNGRLTALHACSDLWASGAAVASAQALVTLPEAAPELQEELLLQTLAGVRSVLDPLGAPLVGGHTLEGRDGAGLSLALAVNGAVAAEGLWCKGPLAPGDRLLLSRPLGSGVLFAAAMAGVARPDWITAVLEHLQQSQAALVELLAAHGCRACTDITGFGLLGHLGEMLEATPLPLRLELEASAIPAYPGALELLERGFASSLAPANGAALALLVGPVRLVGPGAGASGDPGCGAGAAQEALLIDPQTCGPLLAVLPQERARAAEAALRAAGFREASLVGRVLA
jgi:selenide,water dikinase